MDDLEGQQTGDTTNELTKVAPRSPIKAFVALSGAMPPSSMSRSSVKNRTMFGAASVTGPKMRSTNSLNILSLEVCERLNVNTVLFSCVSQSKPVFLSEINK